MKKTISLSLMAYAMLLLFQGCSKNQLAIPSRGGTLLSKKNVNTITPLANGVYTIYNALIWPGSSYNRVVEASGESKTLGDVIQQKDFGQWKAQTWRFSFVGLGCYKIINTTTADSSVVLTTGNIGSQCTQQTYTGAPNQLFVITTFAPYGLSIISPASYYNGGTGGALLTLDGGSTNNGTKITLTAQSGSMGNSTQYWYFQNNSVPVDNTTPSKTITWGTTPTIISSSSYGLSWYPRMHNIGGSNVLFTYLASTATSDYFHSFIKKRR